MSCWDILGIAPTRELAVIKGAYAALLKTTRPDEDAEAYQRLRDSFQAALTYAKAPPSQDEADTGTGADAPGGAQDVPDQDQVDALIASILALWRTKGDTALIAHWPAVEETLDVAPLSASVLYSTEFAHLFIEHPNLPIPFADALRQRFGWGQDVLRKPRLTAQEQVAFTSRLQTLSWHVDVDRRRAEKNKLAEEHERKQAEAQRRCDEDAIRAKYAELTHFARRPGQASTWQAILSHPDLMRLCAEITPSERAFLNIGDEQYQQACAAARRGAQLRTAAGVSLVAVAAMVQYAYRSMDLLAIPAVLVCALCIFTPFGNWIERLRIRTTPKPDVKQGSGKIRNDGYAAQLFSIVFGLVAAGIAAAIEIPHDYDVGKMLVGGFFPGIFMWVMWCMPPRHKDPLIAVIPAVFLFCIAGVASFGVTNPMLLLCFAALWHACAYAAQRSAGFVLLSIFAGTVFVLAVLLTGQPSFVAIGVLVVWLLFAVARRISPGLALVVMSVSVIYNPYHGSDMFVLWPLLLTLTMGGLWLLALRYGHPRATAAT